MALDHSTSRKLKPAGVLSVALALSRCTYEYVPAVRIRTCTLSGRQHSEAMSLDYNAVGNTRAARRLSHDPGGRVRQTADTRIATTGWLVKPNCLTPIRQRVNMVLNVHRNHEAEVSSVQTRGYITIPNIATQNQLQCF